MKIQEALKNPHFNTTNSHVQALYNEAKEKLEDKFKSDIKSLDSQLQAAKQIPSLAWYIFNTRTSDWCFFKMLEKNYIDDIRALVEGWLDYTDKILQEPTKPFGCYDFPWQIHYFIDVALDKLGYARYTKRSVWRNTSYIKFYEQTVEPCFELQEIITRQRKKLQECFANNPLPSGDIDFRYSYSMYSELLVDKKLYQKQYKKSKKIIKRAERIAKIKLFFSKLFKQTQK